MFQRSARRAHRIAPLLAVVLAGCASPPPEPAALTIGLSPTPVVQSIESQAAIELRVVDLRDVVDRARVGEIFAPGGGAPPSPVGGVGGGPAAAAGAAALLFGPTQPTGRFLVVRDPAEVAGAVEAALRAGWLRSGGKAGPATVVEAVVRRFWIQASWTTSCEITVDLRGRDAGGVARGPVRLHSRLERFEGWFTAEAFEGVARSTLDRLGDEAAAALASPAFVAPVDPDR